MKKEKRIKRTILTERDLIEGMKSLGFGDGSLADKLLERDETFGKYIQRIVIEKWLNCKIKK